MGFHDLRHFRATLWVKLGVDLVTVKELLGNADIQTTMRYAHFAPPMRGATCLMLSGKRRRRPPKFSRKVGGKVRSQLTLRSGYRAK